MSNKIRRAINRLKQKNNDLNDQIGLLETTIDSLSADNTRLAKENICLNDVITSALIWVYLGGLYFLYKNYVYPYYKI